MERKQQGGLPGGGSSGRGFALPVVRAVVTTTAQGAGAAVGLSDEAESYDDSRPVTEADVVRIVCRLLAGMQVCVAEEEITRAQQQVRAAVEESYF